MFELARSREDEIKATVKSLLQACDWTQLIDAPIDEETQRRWRLYRTELRDLLKSSFDADIIWPIPPKD